uniref:Soluble ligand binding domain-containing protein n=1 Tax=candidate division WOR-3 bacterium TaxID=2052148 RepID=A0A7C4Y3S9_UNCW3
MIILFIAQIGMIQSNISINIEVWGEVRNPGIFSVPPNINLIEAISFAGGPLSSSDLSKVKIVSMNGNIKIVNVSSYLKGGKTDIPMMAPGDIVIVPRSFYSNLADFVRFMSIVIGAAGIIYSIVGK